MPKKLIVNADDLGLSEKTNDGIMEAHLNGIVTSATLMMTMPAVDHALAAARNCDLDIGLHVDVSWGRSVFEPVGQTTLTDETGQFLGKKQLLRQLALNRIDYHELVNEIRSQVRAFRSKDLPLYHVDVHQHFHGFPVVMKAIAAVAVSEKIPCIRIVNELTFSKLVNTFIFLMFRYSRRFVPNLRLYADHFLGLSLTDRLEESSLCPVLLNLKSGLTELMCHPGYDDPALSAFSRLQSREAEIEALTSTAVKDIIDANEINLTTYRDELKSLHAD